MNQTNNKKGGSPQTKSGRQVRQNPPVNRLVPRDARINLERLVLSQLARQPKRLVQTRSRQSGARYPADQQPRLSSQSNRSQIGAVVRTRLTKMGMSDIRSHRITWVIGYTYVGDGTSGTIDTVYFLPFSAGVKTWLIQGLATKSSGQVPILSEDADVGAAYIADVEKHFARKVIKRMWIHVDSLQPSTSNNMMAVIAPSRGPGGGVASTPITFATAAVTANSVGNVTSMRGAFPIDSWESKSSEITEYIAGGSGPRQNEFELQAGLEATSQHIYVTTNVVPAANLAPITPACFAVAGNSTTTGLRATVVHQISIEQEVDYLDYVGAMQQALQE